MSVLVKPENIRFVDADESNIQSTIEYFNKQLTRPWNTGSTYKDIYFPEGFVLKQNLSEKEITLLLNTVSQSFESCGWHTYRPSYNHIVFSQSRQGIKNYKKDHKDNFLWFLGILFVLGIIVNLTVLGVFKH